MTDGSEIRPGERTVDAAEAGDAALRFIGRVHTPWRARGECPKQGRLDGPECRVEVFAPWDAALDGVEALDVLEIYYWLDRSRRDLVLQNPRRDGVLHGTFALRSPQRPNPIGVSAVRLIAREGATLRVQGLDCLDGTPLIDIKPRSRAACPK